MVRIALDAMGGDDAPASTVAGAVRAHLDSGVSVTLVGNPSLLTSALEHAGGGDGVTIAAASQVIDMDDEPALAVRAKPDCSIRVAARLVAEGRADAMVSAGSTGATLAAALLSLGRTPGVRRPVIAAVVPAVRGEGAVVLVDAGGSADAQPETLVEYARLGQAYAGVRGIPAPTIGLLNVGEESRKGNALARAAFKALCTLPNFVGNVEPHAVLAGRADVVVTDGFTGNIFLKTVEATHQAAPSHPDAAAVVLGVEGPVFVTHGAATPRAIAGAIVTAGQMAQAGLCARIGALLAGPPAGPTLTAGDAT